MVIHNTAGIAMVPAFKSIIMGKSLQDYITDTDKSLYKNITEESIINGVKDMLYRMDTSTKNVRSITLYTGSYGAEGFDEEMERQGGGTYRVYIGFKVPRFLRILKTPIIQSNKTGRYFKRLKLINQ